jgi:type VI secretion system protein ImpK
MREELANLVFPTFRYGLHLQERLEQGEKLKLEDEQNQLRQRLRSREEAAHTRDYGGDGRFLGGHFALVCWLDEIMIFNTPAGAQWKNHTLEFEFYRTADRATLFWEQADLAYSRPDALEVFYLCVVLGFRGRYRDQPAELKAWRKRAEERIRKSRPSKANLPEEATPSSNPEPLRARDRLRGVLTLIAMLLGVMIFGAALLTVKSLVSS